MSVMYSPSLASISYYPQTMVSEKASLDLLPPELVHLICYWIHVDRKTINGDSIEQCERPDGWRDSGHHTQFSRTLARLSLTSKRYHQIALPYLYSYIALTKYDETQLPQFIYTLCRNPDLRPLVRKIDIEGLPPGFAFGPEIDESAFSEAAAEFNLPPLNLCRFKDCYDICGKLRDVCGHSQRLIILLFLLTPNLEYVGSLSPYNFFAVELENVTRKKAAESTAISPSLHYAFGSLHHLWAAGAQVYYNGFPLFDLEYEPQDLVFKLGAWLVPSLRTLRVRIACTFRPIPVDVHLDNLKEITLDTALLTTEGLISLTSACRVLERFSFYSRGSCRMFSDHLLLALRRKMPPVEFLPEDIVPAFSHLKGTLRRLAINRWDGARGDLTSHANFTSETKEMYATWPLWMGSGNLMGSLQEFTALETLKLDSTCLFHNPRNQIPPDLPLDHLIGRLPKSICHLVLPGAPTQMIPALHALALAAASKEFPALRLVEITCDEMDGQKREISIRNTYIGDFLEDSYSKFISIDEWGPLERRFSDAGVKLVHIDSGNTRCFARDVLLNAGLVKPVERKYR
ncbi:hypothetical protein ACSS6W_004540 [Trichoderma asperelloides]